MLSHGRLQVSKVLPKLTRRDYSMEPRLEQLAPMAREDPLLLSRVNNFVVTHKGVGRIRWEQQSVLGFGMQETGPVNVMPWHLGSR